MLIKRTVMYSLCTVLSDVLLNCDKSNIETLKVTKLQKFIDSVIQGTGWGQSL